MITAWPTRWSGPSPPAALVRIDGLHARRGRGPDAVHDRLDAAALVEVGAAEEEQHPPVADPHRPHLAAVPDGGRGGEAGQVADRDRARGGAEGVGGRRPARAHDHRDVVAAAEGGGEGLGRLGGDGVGIGSGAAGSRRDANAAPGAVPPPRRRSVADSAGRGSDAHRRAGTGPVERIRDEPDAAVFRPTSVPGQTPASARVVAQPFLVRRAGGSASGDASGRR